MTIIIMPFQAQQSGTTYVYDVPSMFRQMVERSWREYRAERPNLEIPAPEQIIDIIELVLDSNGKIMEQKRLPGQNTVCLF